MAPSAPLNTIPANPYQPAKEVTPLNTECEPCNRIIPTKCWGEHARGKRHQKAVDAERRAKDTENANPSNGEDFTNVGGPVGETDGNEDSTWSSNVNDADFGGGGSSGGRASSSGGGRGACYGCGVVGHNKRDW